MLNITSPTLVTRPMQKVGRPSIIATGYIPDTDTDVVEITSTERMIRLTIEQAEMYNTMIGQAVDDARSARDARRGRLAGKVMKHGISGR